MFIFTCSGSGKSRARICVHALDWSQDGDVSFECNDDELACRLLSHCRCDSIGFFNLLAGCKPLYVEQWLEYLSERGDIQGLEVSMHQPGDKDYTQRAGLQDDELERLLALFYKIGGFNRLQLTRYMKQRGNPALLSTRYGKEELERFRLLNEVVRMLHRLKSPASSD